MEDQVIIESNWVCITDENRERLKQIYARILAQEIKNSLQSTSQSEDHQVNVNHEIEQIINAKRQ